MRRVVAVAVLAAALPLARGSASVGAAAPDACARTPAPFAGLPGASLRPTVHVSRDAEPVRYTRWRGTVPGFDGMPFSVDVTVPCGARGPLPTVVMAHGFTDDKTVWQETGKGDRIVSRDRPAANSHWNNIWFASRGYAVLNYTARGWRDSCGPDTPGASRVATAPACEPFEHWIHLDDKRWEVRDAQWLTGALVQSGIADPAHLAMTGGSYGGAPTLSAALLAGNVFCGGAPVPRRLGVDPCAGRAEGALAPWTTPDGRHRLNWAAALPLYTFSDVLQVLLPNGRASDGWRHAPPDGAGLDPVGVPIESTLAGLLAAGASSGFFARPGTDPDADIVTDALRTIAGNPFPAADPFVARASHVYGTLKSPITTPPQGRVPILLVHGFTDPLFPAFEPLRMYARLRSADSSYPVQLFLGDLGHDYSGERADEWTIAHRAMNAFLDHHLRPDRTPAPPPYDVTAAVTRCLDHDAAPRVVRAGTWHDLHPRAARFTSSATGVLSISVPGPSALATDPITTATLPLPGSYKGCRIQRPARTDPTAVTVDVPLPRGLTLMGGPVVELEYTTTAIDTPLFARVWDVAPGGAAAGLVTRGVYRSAEAPGGPHRARFQLAPQGYRFAPGHTLRLEVVANDAPYFQASNVPGVVAVRDISLTVPAR